jgi:hypothetical protein
MIRKSSPAADHSKGATNAETFRQSVARVIDALAAARRDAALRRWPAAPSHRSTTNANLTDARARKTSYSVDSARQKLPGARQKIPTKYMKNNKNSPPGWLCATVQHDEAGLGWGQRRCGLEGSE